MLKKLVLSRVLQAQRAPTATRKLKISSLPAESKLHINFVLYGTYCAATSTDVIELCYPDNFYDVEIFERYSKHSTQRGSRSVISGEISLFTPRKPGTISINWLNGPIFFIC